MSEGARQPGRAGRDLSLVVAAVAACIGGCVPGCLSAGLLDGERAGAEGVLAFRTETALAFSERLVVGSAFPVTFRALEDDNAALVNGAVLTSSDTDVFAVEGPLVTVVGSGTAELVVERDGAALDRVTLRSAWAASTVLASGALLGATDSVDARLPRAFALLPDVVTTLLVAAVDRCGGDLLDLHASALESDGVQMSIDAAAPAAFAITADVAGDAELTLKTPGLDDLTLRVTVAAPGDVDEIQVAPSRAEGATVTLFGRAFVDDVEIVSPMSFSWRSEPRVVLESTQGLVVRANVSFPAEGEPPDERPATVGAEVFGETGTLDLLRSTVVQTLGEPARASEAVEPTVRGCRGEPCDPELALLGLLGSGGIHRQRRRAARA